MSAGKHPAIAPLTVAALVLSAGCGEAGGPAVGSSDGTTAAVIGEPGLGPGQFLGPRSVVVLPGSGDLLVSDKSGRIQRLSADGTFHASWTLPYITDPTRTRVDPKNADPPAGYPCGMALHPDGRLFVADTHYHRVLIWSTEGRLLGGFGTRGTGPGEFIWPTGVAFGADGSIYVSEYGGNDRVQKFDASFKPLLAFGHPGRDEGCLSRPQSVAVDRRGRVWVSDSCNHRLCVWSPEGKLLRIIGGAGEQSGQFRYPYGLTRAGDRMLVVEMGNCRIQVLSEDGESLFVRGGAGRKPGTFNAPWAAAVGADGRWYVADYGNHRVGVLPGM